MDSFEHAQVLFAAYEQSGNIQKLRESLNILDELIEMPNSQRAINFKATVRERLGAQITDIIERHNIPDFGKGLPTEELARLIDNSMTEEDTNTILALYEIQSNYFDNG